MLKKLTASAPTRPPAPSKLLCSCPGCHLPRLKRMEAFNAQLSQVCDEQRREIDSLRRELDELRRRAERRAA